MACRRGIYGVSRLLMNTTTRVHNNVSTQKKTAAANLFETANATGLTLKDVPGPKPSVPFIGTAWQYLPGGRYNITNVHQACIDKFHRYGSIVREEFQWRKPVVHLYNPEDFETVFKFQGTHPVRPISEFLKHYRENNPEKYDTVGLANSTGEEWARLRKVLGSVLLQLSSFDRMMGDMNSILDDFVNLLRKERDQDTFCISNLQDMVYRLALEAIYMMSLETRLGCLAEKLHPESPASSMIYSVKLLFEAFQELYYGLPLWKLYPTPAYKKLDKAESIMYAATNKRIQEAIEEVRRKGSPENKKNVGVLQTLINTEGLTDKEARVTVIDFISGGIFTVTNAFSFLVYHISRNPDVQDKLYRELQEVMPDGVVTTEGLGKLKYLKACVKESFRLTPTIPTIARILPDRVEVSGYQIPAGTTLFCNYPVPCKNVKKFPEPERYIPERWMQRQPRPYTLLPFGFGVRMCVGRRFAEMELYSALCKLVQNFKIISTGQEVKCKQAFIVVPSHPVSIVFKDRKSC